jgi:dTDP-4-amino-4,6-dideoxygalactose transaminase
MKINFVDLGKPYKKHKKEIDKAIQKVLDNHNFVLGEELFLFEKEFAEYCGAKYCVGVASGTDALMLSLKALGVGPGDEVITVANSFIATAASISLVGAKPVLTDIDKNTYNIDVSKIEEKINKKTKVILPVHLYGRPADMDPIIALAKKYKLKILEDACQAHGAKYKNRRIGSIGDITAFSFYPVKNLGAYGEAGAITTNNSHLAEKIRMLRNHGQKVKYKHVFKGYNSRLDTIQAAVLRVKLKYLDEGNTKRRKLAELYNKLFKNMDIKTPNISEDFYSVFHLYVIEVKKRRELMNVLKKYGISTQIHYPIPIHLQIACKDLGYKKGSFKITEQCSKNTLSLPMYPELTENEVRYIASSVKKFLK